MTYKDFFISITLFTVVLCTGFVMGYEKGVEQTMDNITKILTEECK